MRLLQQLDIREISNLRKSRCFIARGCADKLLVLLAIIGFFKFLQVNISRNNVHKIIAGIGFGILGIPHPEQVVELFHVDEIIKHQPIQLHRGNRALCTPPYLLS